MASSTVQAAACPNATPVESEGWSELHSQVATTLCVISRAHRWDERRRDAARERGPLSEGSQELGADRFAKTSMFTACVSCALCCTRQTFSYGLQSPHAPHESAQVPPASDRSPAFTPVLTSGSSRPRPRPRPVLGPRLTPSDPIHLPFRFRCLFSSIEIRELRLASIPQGLEGREKSGPRRRSRFIFHCVLPRSLAPLPFSLS